MLWMLLLLGFVLSGAAQAENVLNDISYTALPGGKVEVTLKFASPVSAPHAFSTESPPSIALDFADTRNAVSKRHIDISAGATSGVSAIEAAGRTRVVVDLFRVAGYDTRTNGNNVVLTINNGLIGTTSVATSVGKTDPTKAVSASNEIEVSNVDFRRGKNGEGRVVVSFNGPGAAANLKREGGTIVLDMLNVKLPPNQAQHLDVLDFATPVQSIDTRARNNGVHMEIVAKQPFEQLAYQTGNEYVVEISQKKDEAKLKGKNAEPEYNGSRVTFNFQDIPARSVLQLIADVSDLNIVVADSVQGNVTLRLINVPWDQALDIVLQAKGLDKRRRGNVIWVAPQKEIADREESIADARLKMEDKEALVTDYIPVSYGKAKDIAALLTKETQTNSAGGQSAGGQVQRGFLSSRGSVSYDDRTNTLLVSDIPSKIQEIRQLVAVLDRPVQQVLIESRIVIATDSFARELGVKFGISGGYMDSNNNVISTAGTARGTDQMNNVVLNNRFNGPGLGLPNTARDPQIGNGILVPSLNNRLNVNMPATNPAGSFGLAILGADYLLDLELSAAQTEGRGEVISSPRVITANQREADIKQGQEVGYVTFQNSGGAGGLGTATVQFKEAVLELKVTPTITADDRVVLNLNVKKDAIAGFVDNPGGGRVPTLDKREINTEVLVDNGQTVVLGGVYEVSKSDTIRKVPLLGDMPVLGNLFKNNSRNDTKAELLIFVTPRILSDSLK
ncbi:type IV pilus secretin PilQ family protein [Dokdonella soli]|uniref:Type IV pilus secretin PilQ family protein n=1 Tax=Dokdonella soli TaxID=529810 RepID=A0ABP3TZA2_9GAMM